MISAGDKHVILPANRFAILFTDVGRPGFRSVYLLFHAVTWPAHACQTSVYIEQKENVMSF